MTSEVVHKILEPYAFATAAVIVILLVTGILLRRDGRRARDADKHSHPSND